jgi:long-chain acyl-CoA synthetase
MAGVPAVWELIRKGILTKVHAGGAVKEKLFHGAVAAKKASRFLFGGITDAVVFKQVKTATGGRLRYAINGGAALSRETQEFVRRSPAWPSLASPSLQLEIAVVQVLGGYGLTESCAMAWTLNLAFW